MDKKKVVVFGGGSGLSTILRGLKLFPLDITAVVSVSDNGGSSGILTKLNQIPAIGDLRKVYGAMSENKDLEKILNYRFKKEPFKNHPLGNLILLALYEMNEENLNKSIKDLNSIFKINGRVLPVTSNKVELCAKVEDKVIYGEENINRYIGNILDLYTSPSSDVNQEVLKSLNEADMIILSPGSLYTSTLASLCYSDLILNIKKSSALKVYVSNIMTEANETINFKLSDHINAINKILGVDLDYVICNNNYKFDSYINLEYNKLGSKAVICDNENISKDIVIYQADLTEIENNYVRHNALKLAMLIFQILYQG